MKVALIYSGLPRYILHVYDNHLTHLIPENVELDTYFHFWDTWGYTKRGWRETVDGKSTPLTDEDKQIIVNKLQPKHFEFENLLTVETQISDVLRYSMENHARDSNPQNYVFQFYSLYKSFQLLQGDYDIIIRMRTDLNFTNNSPLPFVMDNAVHMHQINCWGGVNDQMGYGSYNAMKHYHETFLNLTRSHIKHPESLLYEQLIRNNVPVKKDWLVDYIIKREE